VNEAQQRPSGWTWAWLGWLGFLVLDFVAAARERGRKLRVLTLSRHVWAWFDTGWKRSVLAAFIAAVGAHLVYEASAWWLLTAIPVAALIVDSVWGMGLIDKAARALALRWLKGKANSARERGSEAMKIVDGWKTWISAVIWIGVAFWALVSGQDLGPIARGIAEALRWETPTGENVILYGMIANTLFAIWGVTAKLLKARQQSKAGATVGELMGPIGYLKAASVDGTLTSDTLLPVRLNMTDSPPVAPHVKSDGEKGNPVVASVVVAPTPVAPSPLPAR